MKWLNYPVVALYYLCFGLGVLLWMNVVVPLAFLTDCSATNNTQEVIRITPVGTVGKQGSRCLLPLYRTSFPFFVLSKRGHFRVGSGETFRFTYDMDDINFSELVIESESGKIGQIIVNPNPTVNQYIVPDTTDFEIDDLNSLLPVSEHVHNTALTGRHLGCMWLMYLVFAIPLIVEVLRFSHRYRRRQQRTAAQSGIHAGSPCT